MTKGKKSGSRQSFLALSQMAQVIHMFKRYRQTHVTAFGVTVPQFNALVQLQRYGELNPSQIADLLFSDRPTTTVILRNLERQGWVARDRDEKNRKFIVVRITDEGKAKLRELWTAEEKQSGDFDPLSCFTDKEIGQLEAMLDKLILHFRNLPTITNPKGAI
ncbi:MarR family winged helix-turn-helix transcriptional regulator [Candidatus Bipolaricaulota bacterium]